MSDEMRPIPFGELLPKLLEEYRHFGTILGVRAEKERAGQRIGPAAGPHTQLCGNLVAAYAAGATCFEFKTVQILEGKELGIIKPCIYVGHEVYNTEWSTELTVEEAEKEYIRAFLMIRVLSRELEFSDADRLEFIMSVGYDLKGIQSEKIDRFLDHMKHPQITAEWQEDIAFLEQNPGLFSHFNSHDLQQLRETEQFCSTVTLSTMHGCPKEQIEQIALYLLEEKALNTYIKLNPTLAGRERIFKILHECGYQDLIVDEKGFEADITLLDAVSIIGQCQRAAEQKGLEFGVKMTNTMPVLIQNQELSGNQMYASGPVLYGISITAAALLANAVEGELKISYSGGADSSNIAGLLQAGIAPVTVSSVLLKPQGYHHLGKMQKAAAGISVPAEYVNKEQLEILAQEAVSLPVTQSKPKKVFPRKEDYTVFCAACRNCVDVCPNRANLRIVESQSGNEYVIHRDRLCNECGCCIHSCVMGHVPYLEKLTVFEDLESFRESGQPGIYLQQEQVAECRRLKTPEEEQLATAITRSAVRLGRL